MQPQADGSFDVSDAAEEEEFLGGDLRQRAPKAGAAAGVDIIPGILSKTVLTAGSGDTPVADGTMMAVVHYTGKLMNGTVFDSSVTRGEPFSFRLGARQVILGWDKGVATMQVGEKCVLRCHPDVAYGSAGAGGVIPPNATLLFEVELLAVEAPKAPSFPSALPVILLLIGLYYLLGAKGFFALNSKR